MVVQGPLSSLSFLINGGMIALVWVLADRITFDCTLIEEGEDASGQGLLDGLTNHEGDSDLVKSDQAAQATRRRVHQPGKTVLWLAAAALPIFGLGQWMLPRDDRWQSSAIMALGGYLFATLSLLVATSFLGVRRYLRQRGVDMPANVTGAWLVGGIVMTISLLAVCFLLPQPGKMLANLELPSAMDSPDWLKPSRYGWGGESAKPGSPSDAPGRGEAKPEDAQNAAAGEQGKQPSGQIGNGPQGNQSGGQNQGPSSESSKDRSESQKASANQGQKPSSQGSDSPDQQTESSVRKTRRIQAAAIKSLAIKSLVIKSLVIKSLVIKSLVIKSLVIKSLVSRSLVSRSLASSLRLSPINLSSKSNKRHNHKSNQISPNKLRRLLRRRRASAGQCPFVAEQVDSVA